MGRPFKSSFHIKTRNPSVKKAEQYNRSLLWSKMIVYNRSPIPVETSTPSSPHVVILLLDECSMHGRAILPAWKFESWNPIRPIIHQNYLVSAFCLFLRENPTLVIAGSFAGRYQIIINYYQRWLLLLGFGLFASYKLQNVSYHWIGFVDDDRHSKASMC